MKIMYHPLSLSQMNQKLLEDMSKWSNTPLQEKINIFFKALSDKDIIKIMQILDFDREAILKLTEWIPYNKILLAAFKTEHEGIISTIAAALSIQKS